MKYYVYVTHTTTNDNGEQTTTERVHTMTADNAAAVHAAFASAHDSGATVAVYADTADANALYAAFTVAHKAAKKATERGGNDTQWRIRLALDGLAAGLHNAGGNVDAPRYVADHLPALHHDARAFVSEAVTGILFGYNHKGRVLCGIANGGDVREQYRAAYACVNRYIAGQRAATDKEVSTEYIIDGGGDIVAISTAIHAIIKGGDKWTPTDGGNMDAATAARLGDVLHKALQTVRPVQRDIAVMLAKGYSQRQIADHTGRAVATVNTNIAIMRDKVAEYIRDNAPEFVDMIDGATVAAAAEQAAAHNSGADKRRTADGAARHSEQMKATQAERARRYRERKAAERKAAEQANSNK